MKSKAQALRAYVTIDGTPFPCVAFDVQYGINAIPTASATLAVGVDEFGHWSPAHTSLGTSFVPATIVVVENPGTKVQREVVLFEGYLVGIGYSKQVGRLSATVSLVHWMIDLTYAVLAISEEHMGGAGDGHLPAVIMDEDIAPVDGPSFLGEFQTAGAFRDYMDDIGGAIVKVCRQMVSKIPIRIPGRCDFEPRANEITLAALQRVATSGGVQQGDVEGYTGAVPAKLIVEESGEVVADSLSDWVKKYVTISFFASNLWDKLISAFAPALQMLVVPTVKRCLLVPYTPCIRQVGMHLPLEDVAAIDIQGSVIRPIRAVGVLSGGASVFSAFGNASTVRTLGCFKGPVEDGVSMYVDVPGWLANLPIMSASQPRASDDVPTATTPDAKSDKEENASDWTQFYDRMAKSIYYQELFRGRSMSLVTNFRYDIAPGSIIQVDSLTGVFGASAKSPGIVGAVRGVQIFFDAEAPRCGTQLQIGYVRTVPENKKMGIDRHPLYAEQSFTGAVLHETDSKDEGPEDEDPGE